MQYDTNFKSRLPKLYTERQHPLLEAAMPRFGRLPGVLLECLLQNVWYFLPSPFSPSPSASFPPMLSLFSQVQNRRYIVV